MQSGSLNWPDSWVLACISTASSLRSEWCEAALPGWMLSWSALLTAPVLTEMSSGSKGGSQKASTFTACPQCSMWNTCTKGDTLPRTAKGIWVNRNTQRCPGLWQCLAPDWSARFVLYINWEGLITAFSPFPSQPSEPFGKCRLYCIPSPREPGKHWLHLCCAWAGQRCPHESQVTPIDNLNEFTWWAQPMCLCNKPPRVPKLRWQPWDTIEGPGDRAGRCPSMRAHQHGEQTQYSTCYKVWDAFAFSHPDYRLGHAQISQSDLSSSLSPVAMQQH